jgi:putative ABC transport system permease protein
MKRSTLLVRQWRNRPGRALATVASVAVAVGAIMATWVAADASRAGYRRIASTIDGLAVLDVVAGGGGRFEVERVPRLADIPGVRAVVPLFFAPTLLRVGDERAREMALGVDAQALVDTGLLALESGRPCLENDEVVLDAALAKTLGVGLDDRVLFFARRRIRRMTVTGLANSQSLKRFGEGATAVVDIQVLSSLSAASALVDRVRVVLADGASLAELRPAVQERLPADLLAELPIGRASMAEDVMHSANLGLDFVTGLTLAMAWFLVGNAMLMNVSERRRGLSLVRVLGATGRQVHRFVTGEAAILGGIGAVVGAALGIAAAGPISERISLALQAPIVPVAVHPGAILGAVLAGVLVAVAAAWWPAREATRIDLLAGLSTAAPPPPRDVSWRYVAAVIGFAIIALGIEGLVLTSWLPPGAAVVGGIAVLLAFVALTPLFLGPIAGFLATLVPRAWATERTLALAQIIRQPVRTALTTGVLVVAVTNGIGLGHAIQDSADDLLGWYDRMMGADWVLMNSRFLSPAGLSDATAQRDVEAAVRAIAGVARVEGVGAAAGKAAGAPCIVVARDVAAGEPLPLEPVDAPEAEVQAAFGRGEAVAGTVLGRRTGVKAGDEIIVEVAGRSVSLRIAALVKDYTSGGSSIFLRRETAARLFGMETADVLLVTAQPGRAGELADPLTAIAKDNDLIIRSFTDFRQFIAALIKGVNDSLWAILGLGFVVGSLGVANTVTMNVLEQRRSLGLLRAVGMSRGRVTRLVVLQSVLLGGAGAVIGIGGGVTTAWFIQLASQPLLGHPIRLSFRPGIVAANVAAALVVTALAAWLPARRAVKADLLAALSAE